MKNVLKRLLGLEEDPRSSLHRFIEDRNKKPKSNWLIWTICALVVVGMIGMLAYEAVFRSPW